MKIKVLNKKRLSRTMVACGNCCSTSTSTTCSFESQAAKVLVPVSLGLVIGTGIALYIKLHKTVVK